MLELSGHAAKVGPGGAHSVDQQARQSAHARNNTLPASDEEKDLQVLHYSIWSWC